MTRKHTPTPPPAVNTPALESPPRLQVVIYLAKTGTGFPELQMRSCEEYADAHRWEVCLTVLDDELGRSPDRRPILQAALDRIRSGTAGAILVPSKVTISPMDGEFDDFSHEVERAGGFIQVASRR
ncbi:recombinase family protein [Kitasatospora sp. NPDC096077]|uniref:recombinase family protein n=1 Tax=Kitasatospora sp. NPDC096077 TaxID=3155544 RepID=UPI003333EFF8